MTNPIPTDPHDQGAVAGPGGRYRFCAGRPLNPSEDIANSGVPDSPAALIAMQNKPSTPRPGKPERQPSAKVAEVIGLIDRLDTDAAETLEVALRLVRRLEGFHDEVVEELRDDAEASHAQIIAWSIDADRLMRSRLLLESIDLE